MYVRAPTVRAEYSRTLPVALSRLGFQAEASSLREVWPCEVLLGHMGRSIEEIMHREQGAFRVFYYRSRSFLNLVGTAFLTRGYAEWVLAAPPSWTKAGKPLSML